MSKNSNINRYKQKSSNKNLYDSNQKSKHNNKEIQQNEIKTTKNNSNKTAFLDKYSKFAPFFILFIVFLLYLNSINNDFINWDDDRYVTGNEQLEFTSENIKLYFSEPYFSMYIPFTMISYMIDFKLGGNELNSSIFHSHNLLLHLINTLLVFLILIKLFEKNKQKFIYAFFVSLLFGIHPLHVQSVTWIAERKDVLYAVYFFSSILVYLFYISTKKTIYYILAFVFYLFSLFSKTQAVVLPLIIIIIDYLNRNFIADKEKLLNFIKIKDKRQWKIFIEKTPFLVLSIIFGIIAVKASGTSEPFAEAISSNTKIAVETGYNTYESIMLMSYSYFMYATEMIIPYKQSAIHPYPFDAGSMPTYYNLYLLFPLLVFIAFIWAWVKQKKVVVFSILFFTLNIFIVLKVRNFIISEHYLYIPALGIGLLTTFLTLGIINKYKKFKYIILTITLTYLFFLGIKTQERNNVFENSLTFWNDVTEKYPEVIIAYFNRGNYLQKQGDLLILKKPDLARDYYNQAINDYGTTIGLHPTDVGALSNRGITYGKIGKFQEAIDDFNQIIQLDSTKEDVYSNRGNVYSSLNKWDKAITDYNKAIELKPDYIDAYFNRGVAFSNSKRYQKAIDDFNFVISVKYNKKDIKKERGLAYYFLEEYRKSINDFNTYLQAEPTDYNTMYYQALSYEKLQISDSANFIFDILSNTYPQIIDDITRVASNLEIIGDYNQSQDFYQQSANLFFNILKIDENNSDAHKRIGVLYGKMGDLNKAFEFLNKAIYLNPQNSGAITDRGYAYTLKGNYIKAMSDYNLAIQIDSNNIEALFNRAMLYDKTGYTQKAINDLNNSILIKSDFGQAYLQRGLILQKTGKLNLACSDWQQAVLLGITNAKPF